MFDRKSDYDCTEDLFNVVVSKIPLRIKTRRFRDVSTETLETRVAAACVKSLITQGLVGILGTKSPRDLDLPAIQSILPPATPHSSLPPAPQPLLLPKQLALDSVRASPLYKELDQQVQAMKRQIGMLCAETEGLRKRSKTDQGYLQLPFEQNLTQPQQAIMPITTQSRRLHVHLQVHLPEDLSDLDRAGSSGSSPLILHTESERPASQTVVAWAGGQVVTKQQAQQYLNDLKCPLCNNIFKTRGGLMAHVKVKGDANHSTPLAVTWKAALQDALALQKPRTKMGVSK
ncbi:hypothetical protein P153DRAFT_141451 [Dothidotthia symphoricarpi CBS 119687]|uniref:Uncharacterized protein n=1 Tax=Dothidotthia symphoricarpi CBS 119687 TaxID=1392245 RepID=A0A6A5ZWH6_9PLEO|nr:uncharacterized protein P153DRAFT_141451 [Dothidotthia symphoricarpi CBS 119687]KAF2123940.1 hypothetical protein P153DRAFT_141451 [Dothidotthia symphoricarpi CBS 119687]